MMGARSHSNRAQEALLTRLYWLRDEIVGLIVDFTLTFLLIFIIACVFLVPVIVGLYLLV